MTAGAIAATVPEKYQRRGVEKRRKMLWEGPGRGCIEAKLGCKNGPRREMGGLGRTLELLRARMENGGEKRKNWKFLGA